MIAIPWFAILFVILSYLFIRLRNLFIPIARDLKRREFPSSALRLSPSSSFS